METTWKLGEVIKQFRDRYRLSKSKAAEVLGVSILYVRSLEEGVDVKSGLPFKPREATLLQLAAKMTEFGYSVTFEELMVAAGKLPQQAVDSHLGHYRAPTEFRGAVLFCRKQRKAENLPKIYPRLLGPFPSLPGETKKAPSRSRGRLDAERFEDSSSVRDQRLTLEYFMGIGRLGFNLSESSHEGVLEGCVLAGDGEGASVADERDHGDAEKSSPTVYLGGSGRGIQWVTALSERGSVPSGPHHINSPGLIQRSNFAT